MKNPFNAIYYGGTQSFTLDRNMDKTTAVRKLKRLQKANPEHRYRIVKNKGFGDIAKLFLGFIVFLLCLAIARSVPSIFGLSTEAEEFIQLAFLALGVFGLFVGVLKK